MTLAFLALAWLLGIAAAAFTDGDQPALLAAAGLLGAVSFVVRPRPVTLALIAAGATLIFAAGWRYDSTIPERSPLARLNCEQQGSHCPPARFRAVVSAQPDERGASRQYRLSVREVYSNNRWRTESGGVLMRAALFPTYQYGDLLEIEGELETPPVLEDFDYRDYLLRQGVSSLIAYPQVRLLDKGHGNPLQSALIDLRSRLSDVLADALPEPEASLASGILLGARSDLPQDLKDDMNATGTSHLVAVSGQNVVLVAGLLIAALTWIIGRRPAAWLALAGLIGYAVLVGDQPSVVRAAIMGGLYVIAIALGRQNSAAVALLLAAAGMTVFEPQVVHNVSFQLSFAATLGLITMTPALNGFFEQLVSRWRAISDFPATRPLVDVTTITVAATAFTLPIIAINFQRVSLAAPFANLFTVPAFVAVAATSALTAIVGIALPGHAGFMAWLAWLPAAYMIGVIRLFAAAPLASVDLRGVGLEHAIIYYALLFAGIWWFTQRPIPKAESAPPLTPLTSRHAIPAAAFALLLGLSSLLLWLALTTPESGKLSVTFLDVGQGDAILIQGPDGHRILVDGGPSGEAITAALGRNLAFFDRRLDLVILTHPQADHLGGLPTVLGRYDVREVLATPANLDGSAYRAWKDALAHERAPEIAASRGQWVDLGGGATLTVLNPRSAATPVAEDELNDASVVLRVAMGHISFLLTADIEEGAEAALLRGGTELDATVLKVAHHGSLTSSSPQLLRRVNPVVDVISVGAKNRYGHPAPEVLERLEDDIVLRTDLQGDVSVSTDGRRLWVQTQRNTN